MVRVTLIKPILGKITRYNGYPIKSRGGALAYTGGGRHSLRSGVRSK